MSEKQYMLSDFDSEVEMLEKINEQQAIIKELKEENEQLQGKIKRLNAFIVSKDLVVEYLKWNKER